VVGVMTCLALSSTSERRVELPVLAATTVGAASPVSVAAQNNDTAIRPFRVNVPNADLTDLRRRLAATRWPTKELVEDRSQGVQLATLKALVRYWATDYDWRKVEARLNALPQFITEIDGLDIHFIHVRSRHENALPLIVTHGWPGSVIEQLKIIDPLTNPTAHGANASDAFHLVIPSMPGYGFSGKPKGTGWNPDRIARAWAELMKRLGYTRYVAQGGDWGSPVSSAMARQAPAGLLGIHINLPATIPPEVAAVLDWCGASDVTVVPYGGGSSVVGGVETAIPGASRVVSLDLGRLDRVLEIDRVSRAARIQAGVLGPALEDQLRPHGLTLRHFPQSFEFSSLGGWIATRSGGHYATLYTHIDEFVESLRVLTPA